MEARYRGLRSDNMAEVLTANLVALVRVHSIEETTEKFILRHRHHARVLVREVHVVLVDLIELIILDVVFRLEAVAINEALRCKILSLDLRCLFDLLLDSHAELNQKHFHRLVEFFCAHDKFLFRGNGLGLAEKLLIGESRARNIFTNLTRFHQAWVVCTHLQDIIYRLGCFTIALVIILKRHTTLGIDALLVFH